VWEWCEDWYGDYVADELQTNPKGFDKGVYRVLRGGCYYLSSAGICRVAYRNYEKPMNYNPSIGFRLAL